MEGKGLFNIATMAKSATAEPSRRDQEHSVRLEVSDLLCESPRPRQSLEGRSLRRCGRPEGPGTCSSTGSPGELLQAPRRPLQMPCMMHLHGVVDSRG